MKCSKCNEKLKNSDKYCANCGTKVKKENKFLKFIFKNQMKIIITLIIILILAILYKVLCYVTSPTFVANRYLNNLINNNSEENEKTIDLETNDFLNEKILKEKNIDFDEFTNIELFNKIVTKNEALITYKYKINDQEYTASVNLSKDNKLFSNWKINSGRVSKNVSFKVPTGSIVKIDDINIDKYLLENEDYDLYTIDYMTTGIYKIEITLKDGTILSDNIEVYSDRTYTIDNIQLTEETNEDLKKQAKVMLETLYNGIKDNKNLLEINYNDDIKKIYKNLNYNYKNSNYKINNITYNDLEIINSKYNNEAKLEVTFQTEYNYNITYNLNNVENNYEGINRGYVTIIFDYDENYIIEKIENLKNSFPIRK